MKAVLMRCCVGGGPVRITRLSQLDELVGRYVTGISPETCWEDSNALFRFDSEAEARAAIHDSYYQRFSPEIDWTQTEVRCMESYPAYSSNLEEAWRVVESLSDAAHPLQMRKDGAEWVAAFGKLGTASGSTVPIALCLAGLRARGIEAVLELDGAE